MKRSQNVGVIGAGPAGLSAAYELIKAGHTVTVYEAGPHVGGLCRSFEIWGHRVDLGPHRFFSHDKKVNAFWLEFAGADYQMVPRQTRIYYKRKFFHYPLKPISALVSLGGVEALRCLGSYFGKTFRAANAPAPDTFESWVVARFGKRLFEIFFKSYSEKLWGLPCNELDSDFSAQRIKKISIPEILKEALRRGGGTPKHASLVDQFAYPSAGTGMIYERIAKRIGASRLGDIKLNTPVKGVAVEHGEVFGVVLADGRRVEHDVVISTMPLTHMTAALPQVPEGVRRAIDALEFRNTVLVYLHVDGENLFPDNWLYVQSPELRMGRVTNFRNWGSEMNGDKKTTVLCLEYWAHFDDPLWNASDAELGAMAKGEIESTGLIKGAAVLDTHIVRIPRSYPVYRVGYKTRLKTLTDHLGAIRGLVAIGRYGAFKYNNQDHSILMGLLAAENIDRDAGHDLWAVNCDYESYQEKASISELGLGKPDEWKAA